MSSQSKSPGSSSDEPLFNTDLSAPEEAVRVGEQEYDALRATLEVEFTALQEHKATVRRAMMIDDAVLSIEFRV